MTKREELNFNFECGDGWLHLIESFINRIDALQKSWLWFIEPRGNFVGEAVPKLFDFQFLQVKSKWAEIRIYYSLSPLEHDWTIYDRAKYEEKLDWIQHQIEAMTGLLGEISTHICETCGARGEIRSDNGWLTCLCQNCIK